VKNHILVISVIRACSENEESNKVRGVQKVDCSGEIGGMIEGERRRYWWAKNL
jgi:hypothetical protein